MTKLPRRALNRLNKEKRILEAALKVFSNLGYSGASMDAIAKEARVSKPTLYQYFGDKEQLFAAMLVPDRVQMLRAFQQPSPGDMVEQLYTFSWNYAEAVMRPDLLSLARLVIGEVQRFPEIGPAYQAAGPNQLLQGMMEHLDLYRSQGRLNFEDAELAAQDLWGLILSAPRTQALYMPDNVPTQPQLKRYIDNGLRVFLRAYSTNPMEDITILDRLIVAQFET